MEVAELDERRGAAAPAGAPDAPRRPHWPGLRQPLALAGLAAAGCAYVVLVDPNQSAAYPQCPLRALTGLDCPGCGLTRAVHALLHGDVVAALDHNVLVVVLLPLVLLAFARWTASRLGYRWPALPRGRPWMAVLLGVVLVGFLVARNLPGLEYLDASAG